MTKLALNRAPRGGGGDRDPEGQNGERKLYEEEGAAPLVAGVLIEEAAIRGDRGERAEAFELLSEAKPLLEPWQWELRARLKAEGHRLWRLFYSKPPSAEEGPQGAPEPT